MGKLRAFVEGDIPQVSRLYSKVILKSGGLPTPAIESYLREIYLNNPWRNEALPSLIYEQGEGEVVGFLGVMPRPMLIKGRRILAAVSHDLMVEPDSRSSLAGVKLVHALLAGPQDLTLADEANEISRKIWERLGGSTSILYSIRWTHAIKPCQFARSVLQKNKLAAPLEATAASVCKFVDMLAARVLAANGSRFEPRLQEEILTASALLPFLTGLDESLRPEYDDRSLAWVLQTAERKKGHGMLRKVLLRAPDGQSAGWFLYYLNPGSVGQLLQVGARKGAISDVLCHLFHHVRLQGGIAVTGRLMPRHMQQFSDARCIFNQGYNWVLVQARDPELLNIIHRGDAFLTRLEGEWWIPSAES